jgi:acylphosphatase
MLKTVSIIVTGKVQGVWYRQSAKEKATELGVTGNVRNQPDSSVAIMATGLTNQLDLFIEWCRQGPPRAHVTLVEVTELPHQSFDRFIIER